MEFTVSTTLNCSAEKLFRAWLDSRQHTLMTGGEAKVSSEINGSFTAWDDYISGSNISLIKNQQITQKWRTVEFTPDEEDSILEINFIEKKGITTISITHTNLPEHGMQYKQGWVDNYFEPMKQYFK
ncbi:MAG: SRPBCC domain-containing protein [Bacteroidia bacterium]